MSKVTLPKDQNNTPVQTLELGTSTTKISVSGTTSSAALPSGAEAGDIVRLACNTDCHIAWGSSGITATANDALFTAGVEIQQVPKDATHLAAIQVDTAGVLTITEVK